MANILSRRDGAVLVLTIDNEPKRNAFTHAMTERLGALFDEAEADPAVRCVVLTGAGETAFSSGHDLGEMLADRENASGETANAPFLQPQTMTKPVVAAINGYAHAAGFILALGCDVRVCAPNADFAAPGARIGLLPIGGQLSRLPALIPLGAAFEMLATGRRVGAEEALRLGLANAISSPGAVLADAIALAAAIAQNSAAVVAGIKAGLSVYQREGPDAAARYEWDQSARLQNAPDAEEGIRAFLEKRRPSFA